jgi:hypothetical protein
MLICAYLSACSVRQDPQAALEHATQTFPRGDLARAQQEIETAYQDFYRISPEWAWKFRVLEANVLLWRGMSNRVLTLLASEPAAPSFGELALQKLRLEGLAYTFAHNFQEAERTIGEAERLCGASGFPACGDVISARAGLEMARSLRSGAEALRTCSRLGSCTQGRILRSQRVAEP